MLNSALKSTLIDAHVYHPRGQASPWHPRKPRAVPACCRTICLEGRHDSWWEINQMCWEALASAFWSYSCAVSLHSSIKKNGGGGIKATHLDQEKRQKTSVQQTEEEFPSPTGFTIFTLSWLQFILWNHTSLQAAFRIVVEEILSTESCHACHKPTDRTRLHRKCHQGSQYKPVCTKPPIQPTTLT